MLMYVKTETLPQKIKNNKNQNNECYANIIALIVLANKKQKIRTNKYVISVNALMVVQCAIDIRCILALTHSFI